jgi:2-polyprenyl-6-methoxyphenol hydroxylase-like FAD-dependent oxidoreductase
MKIEEARKYHKIDAVIVGAGLAGLRAALEVAQSGLSAAVVSKVYPAASPPPWPMSAKIPWKRTCSTPSRAAITWPTRILSKDSSMRR